MARSITVDLLSLQEPFDAWCNSRGVSRSVAVRALVFGALQTRSEPLAHSLPESEERFLERGEMHREKAGRHRRFTVRLSDDELRRLHALATDAGVSAARYLVAALRCTESGGTPIASKRAVQALVDSNQQLARIGRRLGVASRLDDGGCATGGGDGQGRAAYEALEDLRRHVTKAATVLASLEQVTGRAARVGAGTIAEGEREKRRAI